MARPTLALALPIVGESGVTASELTMSLAAAVLILAVAYFVGGAAGDEFVRWLEALV
jgi:hypothetical protein